MNATTDILGREEIVRLVDRFYEKVRGDELLGFIFDKVAAIEVAPGHEFEKTAVFWAYGPTTLPVRLVPA